MTKIRNKLLLVLLLVTVLPVGLIGGYSLYSTSAALKNNALEVQKNRLNLIQERIINLLGGVRSDVLFLKDSNALQLFLSSQESGGSHAERLLLTNLRSAFKKFSEQKTIYAQVRFVDEQGKEVVRIDRGGNESGVVTDTHLKNMDADSFFKKSLQLESGEINISRLELAREVGAVVEPRRPVIRYATVVEDSEGQKRGLVILDVDADLLFALMDNAGKQGGRLLLTDSEGYYFYHPDAAKRWGSEHDLGHGAVLKADNPDLAAKNGKLTEKGYIETADNIFFYKPLTLENGAHQLGDLYSITDKSVLLEPLQKYLTVFLAIAAASLLLTLILASILSNSISRPLVKLKQDVENLSRGDIETPIEVTEKNEIGELGHAIELLRKSMSILMRRSRGG